MTKQRTNANQKKYDDGYGFIAGAERIGLIYAAWGFISSAIESGSYTTLELQALHAGVHKALKDRGVTV